MSLNSEPNSSDNFELNNTQPIKLSSEESANVPDTVVKKPKIIANNKFVEIDDFIVSIMQLYDQKVSYCNLFIGFHKRG